MRVLTFNVHGANSVPTEIGAFVGSVEADVACLNEVRRGTARTIATAAGMSIVESAGPWRVRYRNAILSSKPPTWSRRLHLSRTKGLPPRTLVVAGVGGIVVGAAHLGLDASERVRHASEVLAALAEFPSVVLAGDLNERSSGTVMSLLAERLVDACPTGSATYPATGPTARIDYILVTGSLRVTSCETISVALSDHHPVLAEIDVTPYASGP